MPQEKKQATVYARAPKWSNATPAGSMHNRDSDIPRLLMVSRFISALSSSSSSEDTF